jgi:hypothetical protein
MWGTKTKSTRYNDSKCPYISRVPLSIVIVDGITVY